MDPYRDDYWKLAELENRFNELQGALRTLASTWTLTAFAGLALLVQVAEKTTWLAPPAFLAWLISILAMFGLALLWLMDQFVYQRLLGAAFLSGLLLERRHPELPPVRSIMLAGSSGGMSQYLRWFYLAPMAGFLVLGLVAVLIDAAGMLSGAKSVPREFRVLLLLGSGVGALLLVVFRGMTAKVGTLALAESLGLEPVAAAVRKERLLETIRASLQAHHPAPNASGPGEATVGSR